MPILHWKKTNGDHYHDLEHGNETNDIHSVVESKEDNARLHENFAKTNECKPGSTTGHIFRHCYIFLFHSFSVYAKNK